MSIIPKTIHYFWFGHNEKPEIFHKCLESWKRFMPDYSIIEWNEKNYNVHRCKYISQAYDNKEWAFASDYARFDILYKYGGVYLDTDVEFLKPIPQFIIDKSNAFCGMESSGFVAPGLIFACEAGFPFLREIIMDYEQDSFIYNNKRNKRTVNQRLTDILLQKGFIPNNHFQRIADIDIYPSSFFCGYDQDIHDYDIQKETISVHHYSSSWNKKGMKYQIQKRLYYAIGKKRYKSILRIIRKIRKNYPLNK